MDFLYFIIIGGVSGWIAGQIWKGSGFGIIGNIIIGIIGGLLGGWIAGFLGIGAKGLLSQLLISVGGAWVLLFVFSKLKK